MVPSQEQRQNAPVAPADYIRPLDFQLTQQVGGVIRHLPVGERATHVRCMPMAKLLGSNNVVAPGELGNLFLERTVNRVQPTVEEQQWTAFPVLLVVHTVAVHDGIRSEEHTS